MDWSQFDSKVDSKLMDELNGLDNGKTVSDFEEIPVGKYEVVPETFELKTSKAGNPMMVIWFRIVAGQFKQNIIFANFVLKSAFGIHNAKNILKKLDETADVKFESFSQFSKLVEEFQNHTAGKYSFILEYGENKKKYKTYEIVDGAFEPPSDYVFEE